MEKEEYYAKRNQLAKEHLQALKELNKEYALINNPYKVGDLICDHIGKGRILSFKVYESYGELPQLVYRCANLTQKGTINKREPERNIYQSNIK